MDPRPRVAANSELIKEHFSGETLSGNRARPIHSRENTVLDAPGEGKHCKPAMPGVTVLYVEIHGDKLRGDTLPRHSAARWSGTQREQDTFNQNVYCRLAIKKN